MKAKPLFLLVAALLAAGGLWLALRAWRSPAVHESTMGSGVVSPTGSESRPMLRPPNPNRKFEKLTPEERVQLARRGPIGG